MRNCANGTGETERHRNPGPLVQFDNIAGSLGRFLGFFSVLIQASYSFIGTEIVAITAGEAQNPRQTMPRAIRSTFIKIVLFYLLGTFVLGVRPTGDRMR